MACPDFQAFMLPVLEVLRGGGELKKPEIREQTARRMALSAADLSETLSSGRRLTYVDRCNWACTYLTQAGLVTWVRRGTYQISARGEQVLRESPAKIDLALLSRFPEFTAWINRSNGTDTTEDEQAPPLPSARATPAEQIQSGYDSLRSKVEAELIQRILAASPTFFEELVVELLVAMGYGGSIADAGRALGKSGDGGIDGMIKEDKLGLDVIYVQAKRWDPKRKVSRPDIQAFVGSLEGVRARKGVFITTSSFSAEAHGFVQNIEKKVSLIDGELLTRLMFDHGVGVRTKQVFELKEVDDEYFDEA